jgi:hypothetical protein
VKHKGGIIDLILGMNDLFLNRRLLFGLAARLFSLGLDGGHGNHLVARCGDGGNEIFGLRPTLQHVAELIESIVNEFVALQLSILNVIDLKVGGYKLAILKEGEKMIHQIGLDIREIQADIHTGLLLIAETAVRDADTVKTVEVDNDGDTELVGTEDVLFLVNELSTLLHIIERGVHPADLIIAGKIEQSVAVEGAVFRCIDDVSQQGKIPPFRFARAETVILKSGNRAKGNGMGQI